MLKSKHITLIISPLALLISACDGDTTGTPASAPTLAAPPTSVRSTLTTLPAITPLPRFSPTPAAKPGVTIAPGRGQPVQWSNVGDDLIVGMSFEPYPLELGTTTTIKVFLSDAEGRPVTDASVELTVTGGVAGMEGEHDESSNLNLASQGDGLYIARATPGKSNLTLTALSLNIQRSEKRWSFAVSKDELPPH